MKRLALLCTLSAALLSACNSDAAAPHLAKGNVAVNNGKREEAVDEYRLAAKLAPRSALARERLGDTLYDLGRLDEALAAYRDAGRIDPQSPTPRIGAARVLTDQGDLAAARAELTQALERAPSNLYVLLSRGNLAARAGDKKAALHDYETAVHLKSDNVAALYQYGLALLEDGQVPEAGITFDRILKLSPDSPEGYYGRARVFAQRGEGAFAAEALAEAIKRVEKDARSRLAEQGLQGDALEAKVRETTQRSLSQLQGEPAFSRWANEPGFRRTVGWPAASAR